jgi:hypothetical protein
MKVIAFSLSLSRPSPKLSKEVWNSVASRQLAFRHFVSGEEHVSPDFSEVSWRGFLVRMEYSSKTLPRIAFWQLDKFAYLPKSSNLRAVHEGKEPPSEAFSKLNLSYVAMPLTVTTFITSVVLVVLSGLISLMGWMFPAFMERLLQSMDLVSLEMVQGVIGSI